MQVKIRKVQIDLWNIQPEEEKVKKIQGKAK